jgi:four helix bundle protein
MKYERFEDLPVWQSGIDLADGVYALTRDAEFAQSGDLRDQLRRAALSVSNNIAEGFERGSTAELIAFLYIARGSAGEVRSMLHFMERLLDGKEARCAQGAKAKSQISDSKSQISDLKSQISNLRSRIAKLRSLAESCSRQIRGWADSLQNSEIRGQRHLTDDVRRQAAAKKRADAFRRQLDETLRAAQPQIFGQPTVES